MKYLFWNMNQTKKDDSYKECVSNYLDKIICEYEPDIVALAECEDGVEKNIHPIADDARYTIKIFPYDSLKQQVIIAVHLPSKKNDPEGGRKKIILHKIKRDLKRIKEIDNIVYMGDFNMNPFESPMISIEELNAVPSKKIAAKGSRKVYEEKYKFLYNPMWNYLGDRCTPEGTYYYGSPGIESIYWNVFDQFLVSPALINDIDFTKIKIIDKVNELSLSSKDEQPIISDHFPLYFELGGI